MSPIATSSISSNPRGELARDAIRKDAAVIQPHLEVVGRSLDHHRRLETRPAHFFVGVGAEIVYQAERRRPLRPQEDVSAASVLAVATAVPG
jgi:hypothetical protein